MLIEAWFDAIKCFLCLSFLVALQSHGVLSGKSALGDLLATGTTHRSPSETMKEIGINVPPGWGYPTAIRKPGPSPYKEHCLQKNGFFSSLLGDNVGKNPVFVVSEAGNLKTTCKPQVSCIWSTALEKHLLAAVPVRSELDTAYFLFNKELGCNFQLSLIRLRKNYYKMALYDYDRVMRLVNSRRAAWDEAHPDQKVDWSNKRPAVVANSVGFRWLRAKDFTYDDTEEHRRDYDAIFPELADTTWAEYNQKKEQELRSVGTNKTH